LILFLSVFFLGAGAPQSRAQSSSTAGTTENPGQDEAVPPGEGRTSMDNVLRFGVHVSEMGNLDPHFAAASQDRVFADMVFNGLLRYKPGMAPRIEPDLAVSIPEFKMVEGKQVWTLKLRRGVMFHAGPKTRSYEMTADDVIFSLQKAADKNYSAYAGAYTGMTFKKVGIYTVNIILEDPISSILFLPKLTNYGGGFIVSRQAVETMGYEQFEAHPVGSGPFAFKSYGSGKKLILKAHGDYFRGRPLLDGVELHFLPDFADRDALLMAGELDVIYGHGEKKWLDAMKKVQDIKLDFHGVGEIVTIYFNTAVKPLDDVQVRRAIAYALDREAFLNASARRFVGSIYSPVPAEFLPGGLTKEDLRVLDLEYATDLDKARELITEAGYPNGFPLDIVTSEKRIYRSCYMVMKELLARVGIVCNISVKTHSEMHKKIRKDPRPIVIYVAWRPNADVFLTRFFHSDSIVVTGEKPDTNFSHYKKIDRLIEEARLEINPEKQINLWMQAQIRILDDMAAYPIMYTIQGYARKATVDYGHELVSTMALYPQFTEKTRFVENQ